MFMQSALPVRNVLYAYSACRPAVEGPVQYKNRGERYGRGLVRLALNFEHDGDGTKRHTAMQVHAR